MLLGYEIPLRLGYVGVKGRSFQNIRDGVSVREGLEEERKFFASHPIYSKMPKKYTGTDSLNEKLTEVLHDSFRTCLPDIYKEVVAKIHELEDKLKVSEVIPMEKK